MRKLIIDRFEGKFAICEDEGLRYFAIELPELPEGAKAGNVLDIDDEGIITLNNEETDFRKKRIAEKQKKAFK